MPARTSERILQDRAATSTGDLWEKFFVPGARSRACSANCLRRGDAVSAIRRVIFYLKREEAPVNVIFGFQEEFSGIRGSDIYVKAWKICQRKKFLPNIASAVMESRPPHNDINSG